MSGYLAAGPGFVGLESQTTTYLGLKWLGKRVALVNARSSSFCHLVLFQLLLMAHSNISTRLHFNETALSCEIWGGEGG